jgi:hypothetical protein
MTDDEYLSTLLNSDDADDASVLLDRAISELMAGVISQRLSLWLALKLEQVIQGHDVKKVFGISNPEGRPRDVHGAKSATPEQVAALVELAVRSFPTRGDAMDAVANACGYADVSSASRVARKCKFDLGRTETEALKVMAGHPLLGRVNSPGKN